MYADQVLCASCQWAMLNPNDLGKAPSETAKRELLRTAAAKEPPKLRLTVDFNRKAFPCKPLATMADQKLLAYVKTRIRQGQTQIRVPRSLYERASSAAQQDVRELCEINRVDLTFVANA